MTRCNTWRADSFRFAVTGRGAQHFLTGAARQGIRLQRLRCEADGYSARAAGADKAALQALAARGAWQFTVLERRGPGRMAERALARPGLPLGAVLFLVLLKLLSGFVWAMDFGELDPTQTAALRALLTDCGVEEGCYLTKETLTQAQQKVSAQSGSFGWVSLNFTGGCLFMESTPAQYQTVRAEADAASLVARAGGQVLTVRVESGFPAVQVGQYVEQGQLLASGVKADRNGAPVTQAAAGAVLARVEKCYLAEQPLQAGQTMLTGRRTARQTLRLLGRIYTWETPEGQGRLQREWLPLRLGRLALPGCLVRETWWEEQTQTVSYTPETAQAMARRACRLQLLAEFPDARIESLRYEETQREGVAYCAATYIFCADIAEGSDFSPPLETEDP